MRKSLKFLSLATGLSLLAACFNSQAPTPLSNQTIANPMPGVLAAAQKIQANKPIVFDLGSKTSKAAFSFTIKPANGKLDENFKTKASASGHAQKTFAANLTHYRVHLLDLPSVPTGDQMLNGPFTFSSGLIADNNTATQTFIFKNVPANSNASNHYAVAIEAYETGVNITNDTPFVVAPANRIRIDQDGAGGSFFPQWAYRTNGGGDDVGGGGTFDGGVYVDANHDIPTTPSDQTDTLTATLTLWDELGATIDSNVTVSDGNASYNGTIVVQ